MYSFILLSVFLCYIKQMCKHSYYVIPYFEISSIKIACFLISAFYIYCGHDVVSKSSCILASFRPLMDVIPFSFKNGTHRQRTEYHFVQAFLNGISNCRDDLHNGRDDHWKLLHFFDWDYMNDVLC